MQAATLKKLLGERFFAGKVAGLRHAIRLIAIARPLSMDPLPAIRALERETRNANRRYGKSRKRVAP